MSYAAAGGFAMPCATAKRALPVFVFGSNLAGRHGKGAALYARQSRGAIYGQGEGLQGDSYAIPTKDASLRTLPLHAIATYVDRFVDFARVRPELTFEVTAIGCGLAGYTPDQVAPLFVRAPMNCILPAEFQPIVDRLKAAAELGFVDRCDGGHGRTSIKKSHRAEGRNFVD